jgi:folylpolyglutamate synthase/dihydropteroate synthase
VSSAAPSRGAAAWPQLSAAHAEELAERVTPGGTIVASGLGDTVSTALEAACAQRDIRTVIVDESSGLAARRLAVGGQHLDLLGASAPFDDVYLPVHGAHQARNAMCALAAVEAFVGVAGGLDPDIVRESFAALRLPGRLEVIRRRDASSVILDAADDPASAAAMSAALRDEFEVRHRLLIIGLGDPPTMPATVRLETTAALVETAHHVVVRDDSHAADSHDAGPPPSMQRVAASSGATVEIAETSPRASASPPGWPPTRTSSSSPARRAIVGEARTALGLGIRCRMGRLNLPPG